MKSLLLISHVLLGLTFTIFGPNGFLHFVPTPPPKGVAGQYMGALVVYHNLMPVFTLQVTAGALLLTNRFVPLALAILAPIIANIALFHALMARHDLALAVFTVALWLIVFQPERAAFAGLFSRRSAGTAIPRRIRMNAMNSSPQAFERISIGTGGGDRPTTLDRSLGLLFGAAAVCTLADRHDGVIVAVNLPRIQYVPLRVATAKLVATGEYSVVTAHTLAVSHGNW